jgi:hypothetical protein
MWLHILYHPIILSFFMLIYLRGEIDSLPPYYDISKYTYIDR